MVPHQSCFERGSFQTGKNSRKLASDSRFSTRVNRNVREFCDEHFILEVTSFEISALSEWNPAGIVLCANCEVCCAFCLGKRLGTTERWSFLCCEQTKSSGLVTRPRNFVGRFQIASCWNFCWLHWWLSNWAVLLFWKASGKIKNVPCAVWKGLRQVRLQQGRSCANIVLCQKLWLFNIYCICCLIVCLGGSLFEAEIASPTRLVLFVGLLLSGFYMSTNCPSANCDFSCGIKYSLLSSDSSARREWDCLCDNSGGTVGKEQMRNGLSVASVVCVMETQLWRVKFWVCWDLFKALNSPVQECNLGRILKIFCLGCLHGSDRPPPQVQFAEVQHGIRFVGMKFRISQLCQRARFLLCWSSELHRVCRFKIKMVCT